jgi:hypothetical protein
MRQPPASWHTDALVAVAAQTRLQQLEQPGQGSPSMAQPPVVWMAAQVPALLPDGMVQLPLQHSVPEKQTSPIGWQPAAVVMQTPPWQFLEQQVELSVQALPSVVQLPATIGAHEPPAQLPPQHCASEVQALPSWVQMPAQLPLTHDRPQHCTDEVQAPPLATQPAPVPPLPPPAVRMQLLDVGSQVPTQQSPSRLQMPAGAEQETLLPPSPPLVPPSPLWLDE